MGGTFQSITVPEGHCFLLPRRVPHSPKRPSGSMGLVIERGHEHNPAELDRVRWYTGPHRRGTRAASDDGPPNNDHDACAEVLYQEHFFCRDLGTELVPLIKRFTALQEATGNNNICIGDKKVVRHAHTAFPRSDAPVLADYTALPVGSPFPFGPAIDAALDEASYAHNKTGGEGSGGGLVWLWRGDEKAVALLVGGQGSDAAPAALHTGAPLSNAAGALVGTQQSGDGATPPQGASAETFLWQVNADCFFTFPSFALSMFASFLPCRACLPSFHLITSSRRGVFLIFLHRRAGRRRWRRQRAR